MALCSQEDVEFRLQRDLTADAPMILGTLDGLIADAQAHIEAEVGRELESDTHQETFDGGRVALFLRYWPVTAVASVTEDGTTLAVNDDFLWYPSGKLIRVASDYRTTWRIAKPQSIVVVYTGGFLSPDHDSSLEHLGSICAEMVSRAIQRGADAAAIPAGAAGQIQSVSLAGSDTITYATGGGAATTVGGLSRFVYLEKHERLQLGRYKGLLVA